MKRIIPLFAMLIAQIALSQTITVFDINTSNQPIIKAKYYAFDDSYNLMDNLKPQDFELKENGIQRKILSISNPVPKKPLALSSLLIFDLSSSIGYISGGIRTIDIAKAAARAWIKGYYFEYSECAISSFDDNNYINQDFTNNRNLLFNAVDQLRPLSGTDYNDALIGPMAGGLPISKSGKYKKVIVLMTDGLSSQSLDLNKTISEANAENISIYTVALSMDCPKELIEISNQTGGKYYGNVSSIKEAESIYLKILKDAQGIEAAEITWQSNNYCSQFDVSLELKLLSNNEIVKLNYPMPKNLISQLEFSQKNVKFTNVESGKTLTKQIVLTAVNSDFQITNIKSNNLKFDVNPKSFEIKSGEAKELTVSFTAQDSTYELVEFELENDKCPIKFNAVSQWIGKHPAQSMLRLTNPNGGEKFIVGSDTLITWEGVSESDWVELSYSTDKGENWNRITSARGNSYKWENIPKTLSDQCLIKVRQIDNNTIDDIKLKFNGAIKNSVIAFSPDNKYFIVNNRVGLDLYELKSNKFVRSFIDSNNYRTDNYPRINALFSPDGKNLIEIIESDGFISILVWEVSTSILQYHYNTCCAYGKYWKIINNGKHLLIRANKDYDKMAVYIFSLPDLQIVYFKEHVVGGLGDGTIYENPNIKNIVVNYHGFIDLIDKETLKTTRISPFDEDNYINAIISPDEKYVASYSIDSTIKVWDVKERKLLHTFNVLNKTNPSNLCFSPNSKILYCGDEQGEIRQWYLGLGKELKTYLNHKDSIKLLQFAPNNLTFASLSYDGLMILWNINSSDDLINYCNFNNISNFEISPDSKKIILYTSDNKILLIELSTGRILSTISFDLPIKKYFSNNDKSIVSVHFDRSEINLYEVDTGKEILSVQGHSMDTYPVKFSPDGNTVATYSQDAHVKTWDVRTGSELASVFIPRLYYTPVTFEFSPDGKYMSLLSKDGFLRIVEVNTLKEIKRINVSGVLNYSQKYSNNGKYIILNNESIVAYYDIEKAEEVKRIKFPDGLKIIISPDESKIAVYYKNDSLIIYKAHNLDVISKIYQPKLSGDGCCFNSDASIIVANDTRTNTLNVWDVATGKLIKSLRDPELVFNRGYFIPESMILVFQNNWDANFYDLNSDKLIYTLTLENFNTYFSNINSDASFYAECGYLSRFRVFSINKKSIQEDVSNNYFKIVQPEALLKDVDLKECAVGQNKDSLLVDFIENIGQYNLRIDSIYFEGSDAKYFSIVSKFPKYNISSGTNKSIEIRFNPKRVGVHSANIVVISQSDTIVGKIRAQGIKSYLKIVNNYIDFGQVKLGNKKDTMQVVTLKNEGTSPISIKSIKYSYPNDIDFSTISDSTSFVIESGSEHKMDLRFIPSQTGRTSGVLEFHYDGIGSPAKISLIGEGLFAGKANATISTINLSAYVGEEIKVPIIFVKGYNIYESGLKSIKIDLGYNPSILKPIDYNEYVLTPKMAMIRIENLLLNVANGDTIAFARFKVSKGNSDSCSLLLINPESIGGFVDINVKPGKFRLLGYNSIADENIDDENLKVAPNPSTGNVNIQFYLKENISRSIKIYDVNGNKIDELIINEPSGKININLDTKNYSSGVYYIQLEGAGVLQREKLIIIK